MTPLGVIAFELGVIIGLLAVWLILWSIRR